MKPPRIPREAAHTVRQEIIKLLKISGSVSIRQISQSAHISEKEALGHLEHIRGVLGSDLEIGNNIIRINIPITLTGHSLESRSRLDRIEEILSFDWIPGRAALARNDIFPYCNIKTSLV